MKESLTIKIWTMLGLEQRLGEQYMKAMKRPATQTEDGFHTPEAKQGLVSSDLDGEPLEDGDTKSESGNTKVSSKAKGKPKGSPKAKGKPKGSPKAKGKAKGKAKASPKAKTKGKPKGKPKGKGKSKGKGKNKETEEKKAGAGEAEKSEKDKQSLRHKTESWKRGVSAEQKAKEESDGEDDAEKRDYAKARKFNKLVKNGSLPEGVMLLVDRVSNSDAPRKNKTALINALFKKDGKDGELTLNMSGQAWQSFKSNWVSKEEKEKFTGEPRTVFLWKHFNGNEEALQRAIDKKEVLSTKRGGIEYLCTPSFQMVKTKGESDKTSLEANWKVDKDDYLAMASAFAQYGLQGDSDEEKKGSSSSKGKRELVEDRHILLLESKIIGWNLVHIHLRDFHLRVLVLGFNKQTHCLECFTWETFT